MSGRGWVCTAGGVRWGGGMARRDMHDKGACIAGACVAGDKATEVGYVSYWNAFLLFTV